VIPCGPATSTRSAAVRPLIARSRIDRPAAADIAFGWREETPAGAAALGRRDEELPLACDLVSTGALVAGAAASLTMVVCGRFKTERICSAAERSTIGARSVGSS
jgi:hypothetical protein